MDGLQKLVTIPLPPKPFSIHCVDTYGMDYAREYKTLRSVERRSKKSLTIYDKELQDTIFECEYFKIRQKKNDEGIVITIQ